MANQRQSGRLLFLGILSSKNSKEEETIRNPLGGGFTILTHLPGDTS